MTHTQKRILITASIVAAVLLAIVLLFGWVVPSVAKLRYKLAYADWIAAYSRENDLDPYFVCGVIFTESKFNPNAQSGAGARGLMQVMPFWKNYIGKPSHNLFDIRTNLRYGCWYLSWLMNRFSGDRVLATSAYHAGQGTVDGWLKNPEISADGATIAVEKIPYDSTRKYVQRILTSCEKYEELYDFDTEESA